MPLMTKRERLEATIRGEATDRVPVALWRHFPGDDYRPEDLAASIAGFQRRYDFDLVKVTPTSSYDAADWGVRDEWRGNEEGTRVYVHYPVHSPEDWKRLPELDPRSGALGAQLKCLSLIRNDLGDQAPFIQTVFSPLGQAKHLAGDRVFVHMREHPAAFKAGLEKITRKTIRFIEEATKTGIAGLFYAVQHATFGTTSPAEYAEFGKEYDLRVLEAARGLWLNVLHLHGNDVMFDLVADYPVQVWNWHDRDTPPTLREALPKVQGAVCGGLSREATMLRGTPEDVRREIADAIAQTGGRRLVVGTGCVTFITTPESNLRAARAAVGPD
jgi:uroporphyrinogen decarboxylase